MSALSSRCNSSVACLWALLASYQFYGTGHHATIGHVRWGPAFHAGDPHHAVLPVPHYIIGGLISLELFGMFEHNFSIIFNPRRKKNGVIRLNAMCVCACFWHRSYTGEPIWM